ncbi:MAG: histidine phosphatase family protein [Actinomycetota bacterium]
MILLLVRHGVAEDAGADTGYRDEPRALTEEGAARMQQAARGMAALGLVPELILTSPLTRCVQTAEIVHAALGGELEADARLAPGMELEDLADAVADRGDPQVVMACSHQPGLSIAAGELVGGGTIEFRKGALAVVETPALRAGRGVLRALYPPAALRRLGT